ncbi:MAG: hypothetical protein V1928_05140 [Parcubacteria group bacterium]
MKKIVMIILLIVAIIALIAFFYFYFFSTDSIDGNWVQKTVCGASGGHWKGFLSGCKDYCYSERAQSAGKISTISCSMGSTSGCDCGPDKCWNGFACEKN